MKIITQVTEQNQYLKVTFAKEEIRFKHHDLTEQELNRIYQFINTIAGYVYSDFTHTLRGRIALPLQEKLHLALHFNIEKKSSKDHFYRNFVEGDC